MTDLEEPLSREGVVEGRLAQSVAAVSSALSKAHSVALAPTFFAGRVRSTLLIVVGVLFCCYPIAQSGNGFIVDVATDMLLWGALALGLNAVLGWTGLLDIGYIAFFAIGGYTYAILAGDGVMSFWPSLVVGVAISGAAAVVIGLPSLRVHSDYLAIMTLGFGEIVYIAAQNLQSLTGGNDGLYSYPAPQIGSFVLNTPLRFYVLALGLALVALVANRLVRSTRLARSWLMLRDDEIAATTAGIDVWRYKMYAYLYGSVWASLAGAVFAAKLTIVSPESFSFEQSFFVLAAVIVGGVGGVAGSFLGGAVYIFISEGLAGSYATLSGVVFSGAMLLMILLRPKGLLPARALFTRAPSRPPSFAATAEPSYKAGPALTAAPRPAPAAQLVAERVVVNFDGVRAVDAASLVCSSGEVVALIGANGAGKTTLLNAISGLARIREGSVRLLNDGVTVDLTHRPAHSRAHYGIARSFQTPRMSSGLAVWENVLLGRVRRPQRGGRERQMETAVTRPRLSWADALGAVGMADKANLIAADLAYGDQRLSEIARALVANPTFLLMDEPSSGLNETETEVLGHLIRTLATERGLGIIMVEHDMDLVRSAADKVLALQVGAVIAQGTPEQVLTDPAVRRNYLGE